MILLKREKLQELQGDMPATAFADSLGISRSQLWRILSGKTSAGESFIEKFMRRFPDKSVNDYFYVKEEPLADAEDPDTGQMPQAPPTSQEARKERPQGTFFAAPTLPAKRGRGSRKRGDAP